VGGSSSYQLVHSLGIPVPQSPEGLVGLYTSFCFVYRGNWKQRVKKTVKYQGPPKYCSSAPIIMSIQLSKSKRERNILDSSQVLTFSPPTPTQSTRSSNLSPRSHKLAGLGPHTARPVLNIHSTHKKNSGSGSSSHASKQPQDIKDLYSALAALTIPSELASPLGRRVLTRKKLYTSKDGSIKGSTKEKSSSAKAEIANAPGSILVNLASL
jgi:hypothetical protein